MYYAFVLIIQSKLAELAMLYFDIATFYTKSLDSNILHKVTGVTHETKRNKVAVFQLF